ncbi:MAG: heparinase II/III family protein [Armatimonadetes bacterium]|nr:heparinase II/III family protein [Armatimonadota bacterium]
MGKVNAKARMMDRGVILPDRAAVREFHGLPGRDVLARLLESAARPFLIASDRELSVLRRGLTKQGWKRSLYLQDVPDEPTELMGAGLLSLANQWLKRDIQVPDQAGTFRDFYCEEGYGAGRRWLDHRALSKGCLALAITYQIDRDAENAEKAAEILKAYANAYPADGMFREPEEEAQWLIPLAQSYDLIYRSRALAVGNRETVERKLLNRAALRLVRQPLVGWEQAWLVSAVGIVGCAIRDAGLLHIALAGFADQLTIQVGADGLWPESVHDHHFSVLTAFTTLAEACFRMGVDLYNFEPEPGRRLKSMFLAPIDCAYPSFELPAIDDGRYDAVMPLSLYEVAFRRWQDPVFAWVLKTGYRFAKRPMNKKQSEMGYRFSRSSLYAFLFGRDLPVRVLEPRVESKFLASPGICVLRSDSGTLLTMDCGPARDQRHLAALGITLYGGNRQLVCDYGTPECDSDTSTYYRHTASHNTVMVDGKPHSTGVNPKLVSFFPGNYLQLAQGEAEEVYPGVDHTRRLLLVGDVAIVQDFLRSDSERVYDWLLRCEGELFGLPGEGRSVRADFPFLGPDIKGESGPGRENITHAEIRWADGEAGLLAGFSLDAPGDLITARCPAETTARTVPVVDIRRRAESARYLAVLVPYNGCIPTIERGGKTFKISCGSTTHWIHLADAPGAGPEGHGEMETDASIAAVCEEEGNVSALGLHEGSYINLRGEPLLVTAGKFKRIEARLDSRNPLVEFEGASGGHLTLKCHSRAMRVNGHRISAINLGGMATIRLVGVLAGQ